MGIKRIIKSAKQVEIEQNIEIENATCPECERGGASKTLSFDSSKTMYQCKCGCHWELN